MQDDSHVFGKKLPALAKPQAKIERSIDILAAISACNGNGFITNTSKNLLVPHCPAAVSYRGDAPKVRFSAYCSTSRPKKFSAPPG